MEIIDRLFGKTKKEPQIIRLDLAINTTNSIITKFKEELLSQGKMEQAEAIDCLHFDVFKVELNKFIENARQLTNFGIFYKSENMGYYKTKWIEKIKDEDHYDKGELIELFSLITESKQLIIYTLLKETKQKFFPEEKGLSESDMKMIYIVWDSKNHVSKMLRM